MKSIFRLMDRGRIQDALIQSYLARLPTGPEPVLFQNVKLIWSEKVFFAVDGEVVLPVDQTRRYYLKFLDAYYGQKAADLRAPQWDEAANQPMASALKASNR